jgi:hypothetical protein
VVRRLVGLVQGGSGATAAGTNGGPSIAELAAAAEPLPPPPARAPQPAVTQTAPSRTRTPPRPAERSPVRTAGNLRERILHDQQDATAAVPGPGKNPAEGIKFRDIPG